MRASVLRFVTLLAWCGFFVWLTISGEVFRYVGPRTRWVVVFGAVILGLASLLQALSVTSSRAAGHARLTSWTEGVGIAALFAPIAVVMIIPEPTLGSEAAARKTAPGFVDSVGSFAPVPQPGRDISFPEINLASESSEYAAAVGIADGTEVRLTGFVTHPEAGPPGTFALTRFATFCCAADAVPYSVTVEAEKMSDPADDTWLTVSGTLVGKGNEFVLQPERITKIHAPQNPYIY
ncbi:MAG TPA: TIGR03943 family protein [Actinomycetota bacterium]|nr:TIGR03943 family protein [Actinomycetota bacterium]